MSRDVSEAIDILEEMSEEELEEALAALQELIKSERYA